MEMDGDFIKKIERLKYLRPIVSEVSNCDKDG